MNRILSDYLVICNSFREDGLSKSERKQRHTMLSEWEKCGQLITDSYWKEASDETDR